MEVDDELMDIQHDVDHNYTGKWGRGLDRETIRVRLMQREFEVDMKTWFSRAWYLYTQHWKVLTIWGIIYVVCILCSPLIPSLLGYFSFFELLIQSFTIFCLISRYISNIYYL